MMPASSVWKIRDIRNPEGNKSANIAPDSGSVFVRQPAVHIEIFAAGCRAETESEDKQDCGFFFFLVPYPGTEQKIVIRGGKHEKVTIGSARLQVCSHGKKRFVVALKYEGEKDYRYIIASDLSWRSLDIVQAYTLRWLIEVFFEDWKISEGWGRLTKHTGEKGSRRGVILSLLTDHCLFFHPDQQAFIDDNLTACTVGSLIRRIRIECFLQFVRDMVTNEENNRKLDELAEILKNEIYQLKPSSKHMSGRKLESLEPTPSLKYKNAA